MLDFVIFVRVRMVEAPQRHNWSDEFYCLDDVTLIHSLFQHCLHTTHISSVVQDVKTPKPQPKATILKSEKKDLV